MKDYMEETTTIDEIKIKTITLNELNRQAKKEAFEIIYCGNEIDDSGNLCMMFKAVNDYNEEFYRALVLQ